jgi:hypothetical protein
MSRLQNQRASCDRVNSHMVCITGVDVTVF